MRRNKGLLGMFLTGPAILACLLGTILLAASRSGETWGYFSTTANRLVTITTGIWAVPPAQPATSLEADKTAAGFWEAAVKGDRFGARGQVCVANIGDHPTENLAILDVVQIKIGSTKFADYAAAPLDLSPHPVLAPGESFCYPYEIEFLPVEKAKYRNLARVTITNHAGWLPGGPHCPGPDPCPFGPEPKISFELPLSPDEGDENIRQDPGSPPSILPTPTLAPSPSPTTTPAPPEGGDSPRPRTPTPTSTLEPTPTLFQTEPPVPTETLPPTPTTAPTAQPGSACTHSPAYWLAYPGQWPLKKLSLGGRTVSLQEALAILASPSTEDASILLAQQLIAARLNAAAGVDTTMILDVLQAAELWLEAHPPGSAPSSPARDQALILAEDLEAYNLGQIGPGACREDLPTPDPTQIPPAATPDPSPTPPATPTVSPTPSLVPGPTTTSTATPSWTPLPSPTPTDLPPTEETVLPTPTPPG